MEQKNVTPEEIRIAYEDEKNLRTIKKVTGKYAKQIDPHELVDCGVDGLIKCLKKHEDGRQEFTSSLYTYVNWECLSKLKHKKRKIKSIQISALEKDGSSEWCTNISVSQKSSNENELNMVLKSLELIDEQDKNLISDYYYNKMSLEKIGDKNGYSKETARKKIAKAILNLRQKFLEGEING